nr:hypothetical protein [Tanacetum cinerariifolium]
PDLWYDQADVLAALHLLAPAEAATYDARWQAYIVNKPNHRLEDTIERLKKSLAMDSAHLSSADLTFFFSKLDSIPVLKMRTKEQLGTDGITVYNTISRDSVQNKFQFWSPRKASAPQEHKLVEAVLGLARRKFTTQQEQEYFESLEQYFDFGLPCKVTSTNPFEV